jgi:hypothetical protein
MPTRYRRISVVGKTDSIDSLKTPVPGVGPVLSIDFNEGGKVIARRANEAGEVIKYQTTKSGWEVQKDE